MNKQIHIANEGVTKLCSASQKVRNSLNQSISTIKVRSTSRNKRNPESLKDLCLQTIAYHFTDFSPHFHSDLFSDTCRNKLLQIMPTNLPLELTSKVLPDGIFWKRAYQDKWSQDYIDEESDTSWKNAYMQKHLQNYVETSHPNDVIEDETEELIEIVREYVYRLNIDQLPASNLEETTETEAKHLDLRLILPFLTKLENLSIRAAIKNIALQFSESLFELTTTDCINIAESLRSLKNLQKIKISSCNLNQCKLRPILLSLVSLPVLRTVDFSSNDLSDDCLIDTADILATVRTLEALILVNNKIGPRGIQHFAAVLHEYDNLKYLNLRLNFIEDSGAMELFKAAKSHSSLLTLILASTKLNSTSVPSLCDLILANKCIQEIDLSCNNLGNIGGMMLVDALRKNNTIRRLNVKMNNLTAEQDDIISEKLTANRKIQRIRSNE